MRFQNLNLRTLESNLSDFYISENLVEQLKRFNILTLIDLANYTKSFLKNRLSNAHYTESVTLLLKYRIFENFDLKKVIRSYNKIEDEDFNIEKIKIFLKSSKSRSVINFCEEIEINKDLLFYHFADLLLNENFPEIKISPYQLDIVNKEIN